MCQGGEELPVPYHCHRHGLPVLIIVLVASIGCLAHMGGTSAFLGCGWDNRHKDTAVYAAGLHLCHQLVLHLYLYTPFHILGTYVAGTTT